MKTCTPGVDGTCLTQAVTSPASKSDVTYSETNLYCFSFYTKDTGSTKPSYELELQRLDFTDVDPNPWTCKELGKRTPGKQVEDKPITNLPDWVDNACAKHGTNGTEKQCCAWGGMQCFEKK